MEATAKVRPGGDPTQPSRRRVAAGRWGVGFVFVAVVAVVLTVLAFAGVRLRSDGKGEDAGNLGIVFTIPYGTYQRVMQWNDPAVEFPPEIHFARGEVAAITIRNEDYIAYRVGPFVVAPGQTYTQRFPRAGTYVFDCAIETADGMGGMTEDGGMTSMGGVDSILVTVEG